MTTATDGDLKAQAGVYLLRAMFQAKSHFHHSMDDPELSTPVAAALILLEESMPMSDLADRIGCDPSYVTGIADRLEELGLAERQPWPADRRVKQLVVTPAGKSRAAEIAHHASSSNPLFEALDETALHQLIAILDSALADPD